MICCSIDGLYRGVSYRGYLQYRDIVAKFLYRDITSLLVTRGTSRFGCSFGLPFNIYTALVRGIHGLSRQLTDFASKTEKLNIAYALFPTVEIGK